MRQRSMRALKRKQDKEFIKNTWPPGTLLRHKKTGEKYMIGVRSRVADFWVMPYNGGPKRLLSASDILEIFYKWRDETLQN